MSPPTNPDRARAEGDRSAGDGAVAEARSAEEAERALRLSVAFVWLATGVCVLHPHYRSVGAPYLAPLGFGPWLMFATCAGEVALALYLALKPMSWWLAGLQTGAVIFFTLVLGVIEPMLLVHYLGVLSKNVPLLAVLWASWLLARAGWSKRVEWLLRAGLAAVWLTEGIFPKLLFQQPGEVAVVMSLGLTPKAAGLLIAVAGALQALSGLGLVVLRGRGLELLLLAQAAALVVLPLLVTASQPLMWVHPFGPLTKTVPLLVATVVLWRRCRSSSS